MKKNNNTYILPTAYFGPMQYYCRMVSGKTILIEQYDNYSRQTYRNRCVILGANGPVVLSVPVKKPEKEKALVKDIRIDYSTGWQKNHYRSLISAYRSSPFFEFYFDDYQWIFSKKTSFLIELNVKINDSVISQLGLDNKVHLSRTFKFMDKKKDLRNNISPKISWKKDLLFNPVEYTQVFSGRFGFVPNLSIIDLLFNTGPEALTILEKSLSQKKKEE